MSRYPIKCSETTKSGQCLPKRAQPAHSASCRKTTVSAGILAEALSSTSRRIEEPGHYPHEALYGVRFQRLMRTKWSLYVGTHGRLSRCIGFQDQWTDLVVMQDFRGLRRCYRENQYLPIRSLRSCSSPGMVRNLSLYIFGSWLSDTIRHPFNTGTTLPVPSSQVRIFVTPATISVLHF
jgi:hypothetical protein